jgi:hypothetical protein
MDTILRLKQVIYWPNSVIRRRRRRRRRPGGPLKKLLDGYNLEAETGNLLAQLRDQKTCRTIK